MLELQNIDLSRDPQAARYVKDEIAEVIFAQAAGALMSAEGPNTYQIGDALITGSTCNHWSVSRQRFEAKYAAADDQAMGQDGRYGARPVPVFARHMQEAFTIARSVGGDLLQGQAGDWLMQYGPGDYGIVEQARFAQVYRLLK